MCSFYFLTEYLDDSQKGTQEYLALILMKWDHPAPSLLLPTKMAGRWASQRSCAQLLSCVWLFASPWAVALQAPLSMGFAKQEYWTGLLFPTPGDLPNLGIKPTSPASSALAGKFFTTVPLGKPEEANRSLLTRMENERKLQFLCLFHPSAAKTYFPLFRLPSLFLMFNAQAPLLSLLILLIL